MDPKHLAVGTGLLADLVTCAVARGTEAETETSVKIHVNLPLYARLTCGKFELRLYNDPAPEKKVDTVSRHIEDQGLEVLQKGKLDSNLGYILVR
jgi:hypothetical protein